MNRKKLGKIGRKKIKRNRFLNKVGENRYKYFFPQPKRKKKKRSKTLK